MEGKTNLSSRGLLCAVTQSCAVGDSLSCSLQNHNSYGLKEALTRSLLYGGY